MANYVYGAIALTGGIPGSLDSINGDNLAQNDAAIVFTSTVTYIYNLDESNGNVEDSPELITPDDNAGTKRWVLISSRAEESSLDTTNFNGILDLNDNDVQKALSSIDNLFSTNDFSITPGSVALKDSVLKSITDNTGTTIPSNHNINMLGSGKINTTGSNENITISIDDLEIVTKTSAYNITISDDIVVGDCINNDVTLTLPQASTKSAIIIFKKSSSNNLIIQGYGSETIEGNQTFTISDEYGAVRLISDGTNTWVTTAQMYDLPTASSSVLGAIKIGDNLQINNGVLSTDLSSVNEDIIPDTDNIRSLGSPTNQWKEAYIGPGSLYVNGQKVIQDSAGTIILSADENQNVQIKTGGGGDIEFYPSGTGNISIKGSLSIQPGKNLLSGDGNAISCTVGFDMNGELINNLSEPINDSDAATKAFASNASNLTTGTLPSTQLPGDYLEKSDNLSSLTDPEAARINIGLSNIPNIDTTDASNITSGTLPSNVIPDLAISSIQVVSSEAAMLALSTQQGDTVIRTDQSKTYIHNGGSAGTMADFTEISTPVDGVTSVNGEAGPTVVLTQDNISNGATYVQTQNNFTPALLNKLNGIEASADVNMTSAELKTAYESNANTNAFTDAFQSKLNGIESGATTDQTATEILNLIKTVDGSGSGLDADVLDGHNSATAATANTIVLRDSSGHITGTNIYSSYLSMSHGITTRNTDTTFYSSTDAYIRKNNATGFKTSLGLQHVSNYAASVGVTANTVVLRNSSGDTNCRYANSTYVNMSHSVGANTTDTIFYSSKDDYVRKNNAASFRTSLSVYAKSELNPYITKLNGIESGATADQTAAQILALLKTVDGSGSGLDADLLDGKNSLYYRGLDEGGSTNDPNTTTYEYMLTNHTNSPSHSYYWHIRTQWYSSISTSSNCAQIAISYNAGNSAYVRRRYSGTWTAWARIDNDAADILAKLKTVDGSGSGLDADLLDGHQPTSANTANTIVQRNASGNFSAGTITATVTTAKYSDLAEKYTCANINIPVGTIMSACIDGNFESEECLQKKAINVIGVISENPGVIMNSELENSVLIGIVGKVLVRIIGPVTKGSAIISAGNGCARQITNDSELIYKIGIALEEKISSDEELIYCSIK